MSENNEPDIEIADAEETTSQPKNPSYVGGWLGNDLYLEVKRLDGRTEVNIKDKSMKVLVALGDFDKFLKKIKGLEKLAEKAGEE